MKLIIVSDGTKTAVLLNDKDIGRVMDRIEFISVGGEPAKLSGHFTTDIGNEASCKKDFFEFASDILGYKLSTE